MMEHLGLDRGADLIERAAVDVIARGQVTADLGGTLGTRAAGDAICEAILRQGV
jgi:3-isopropylmalate dehydrogenase